MIPKKYIKIAIGIIIIIASFGLLTTTQKEAIIEVLNSFTSTGVTQ